jgi:hypothetical protein
MTDAIGPTSSFTSLISKITTEVSDGIFDGNTTSATNN